MEIRKRVYDVMESHPDDRLGRMFGTFIVTLITLNVIAVALETVQALHAQFATFFHVFDVFSVMVFTVEYALRLWSCTAGEKFAHPVWGRLRYITTPMAVVDLLAILPFYLPMFVSLDLRIIRAVRLVRLFRILKIGRYSDSLRLLLAILRSKKEELLVTLFIALVLLTLTSSLMFFIENGAQPGVFSSIPAAMWWGVATLTTVGYGDIYPVTVLGKLLGAFSAIFGIGMFALPAGILGSALVEEMHRRKDAARNCPHCGKKLPD